MSQGKIIKVSGPLVVADGLSDANMADVVRVGEQRLIGEILNMTGDRASIQVYEETSGLGPGAAVESTGAPLSVELGPGIIENIYDGIQRPLEEIVRMTGPNLKRGVEVPALSREKKWAYTPAAKVGDRVIGGDVLGTVPETEVVLHKIMVPNGVSGVVEWAIGPGEYIVDEVVAKVRATLDDAEVVWQMAELGKVDAGGGGTVACYMANRDIDTLDAGVPVLSMHSPFETVSKLDCYMTYAACKAVYEG